MTEVRCPMCSKPNPEDAETCGLCGARLKPLIVDQPSEEEPRERDEEARFEGAEEPEEMPDWLARMRVESEGEVPSDQVQAEEPSRAEDTEGREEESDWLDRMRMEAEGEVPEEEGEAEKIPEEEIEPEELPEAEESPDWLDRLREVDLTRDEGPPEGEVPDWLSAFAEEIGEVERPEVLEPEWLEEVREREAVEEPEEGEEKIEPIEEDWLARLREEEAEVPEGIWEEVAEAEAELEGLELEMEPPSEEIFEPTELEEVEPVPSPAEPEEILPEPIVEVPAEMPWDLEEPVEAREIPSEPAEEPLPEYLAEAELPPEIEPELEAEPAELEEEIPTEEGLPHVPALIFDEGEGEPPREGADIDLDAIELPEWLAELRVSERKEVEPTEAAPPDLAPATLPSWLEAMRPIETFRSVVEVESVDEQIIESAGPLAGLRGVLMAEPVVAMPRSASVSTARLEVTERQYAQAELLHRMVEEEGRELPDIIPARVRLPFLRWVIGILLILAVALPSFGSIEAGKGFPLPSRVPRDLEPLFGLVETVSLEQPILVVFDYSPGYYGELNVIATPLIKHIMARGLQVATISTQPTGSPLAEGLLNRVSEGGDGYVHLGYLSGGPTAVQLFAASPREAILRGFRLLKDPDRPSGWRSPIVEGVNKLSDFGMIVVITAGTDNARTWAEQAYPRKGDAPLVMVLSTGTEPLIRPYYEALKPQVDGILTSMPAAAAYERILGYAGNAQSRWNAFGTGMLTVELILIAGVIYGIALWFLRPQVPEGKNTNDG